MRRTKPPRPSNCATVRQTRPYARHERNPAGSKLVRQFYRAKHGHRDTFERSERWYRAYSPRRPE